MNASGAADTIVAVSTAPGRGGVGIVRLSGPRSLAIAGEICGKALRPRHAHHAHFVDARGAVIDDGLAIYFPGPRSFTGEDVVELQAHGSMPVLRSLIDACVARGARPARAGEFSERAFLNGRIDLTQAEAIADLIAAQSQAQARAARRSLDGEFSRRVEQVLARLIALRMHVEAAIDFPEEEIDFLSDTRITEQLRELIAANDDLLRAARQGQRLRDGLHAVIIGPPNAGKSSLLNALAGAERAIVTDIAGTTRDLLREQIMVDGVELTLVDTAGLRHTDDRVEAEGVRRARAEIDKADLVLIVIERGDSTNRARLLAECASVPQRIVIHNKIDRVDTLPTPTIATATESTEGVLDLFVSALTGAGLDRLRAELSQRVGGEGASEATWSARARHVEALIRVDDSLRRGAHALEHTRAGELLAEELRQAQQALGEITGAFRSDDLLGAIFASFCIGK